MRAPYIAMLLLFASHAALGGAPKPRLADTWWSADADCYITDIVFAADGRASIFYQDGANDGADWTLSGSTLTLAFDRYDDRFTGRYSGSTIRALHRWREDARSPWQTEDCVFREELANGNPGGGI